MKKIILLISAVIFTFAMASAGTTFSANDPPGSSTCINLDVNYTAPVDFQVTVFSLEQEITFSTMEGISPGTLDFSPIFAAKPNPFTYKLFLPEIRRLTHPNCQTSLNNNLLNYKNTDGLLNFVASKKAKKANRCRAVIV